jgi:hypothetical protein
MELEGSLPCSQEPSKFRPGPRLLVVFRNKLIFYGEELAPPPTLNLEATFCRLSASAHSVY